MLISNFSYSSYGLLLPQSEPYLMSLAEIESCFGSVNHARRNVFQGLVSVVENLAGAGVERIVLGDSFISQKQSPQDADIAWWYNANIDWDLVDPVFMSTERRQARGKYLIDHKIDGVEKCQYKDTHEAFLRVNTRMPIGYQDVGIVQIQV